MTPILLSQGCLPRASSLLGKTVLACESLVLFTAPRACQTLSRFFCPTASVLCLGERKMFSLKPYEEIWHTRPRGKWPRSRHFAPEEFCFSEIASL